MNLVKAKNNSALLVVPHALEFLSTSMEMISKVYGIAKKIYPNLTSIIIVTGTEYDLISSGDITLHNIEEISGNMNGKP